MTELGIPVGQRDSRVFTAEAVKTLENVFAAEALKTTESWSAVGSQQAFSPAIP